MRTRPGARLRSPIPGTALRSPGATMCGIRVHRTGSMPGDVHRETLVGLLVHNSRVPAPLQGRALSPVVRDLIGFGKPKCAADILTSEDHEITLGFESRIMPNTELVFPFVWPQSLVNEDGSCRGAARMTLVATPPLDPRCGAEFVRVSLDAALQQEKGGTYASKLTPSFLPDGVIESFEEDLIEHSPKWSPVKTYKGNFPRGVGKSSNWRIHISYLVRVLDIIPPEGIPFFLALTISDIAEAAPVFREMRQALQALGIVAAGLQIAARLRRRV